MLKPELNEIPQHIIKLICEKTLEKRNLGQRELENCMRQSVDFRQEESISNFIKLYTSQVFDQIGMTTFNPILRKSSFTGYSTISNILKTQEIIGFGPAHLLIHPLISSFRDSDPKMIVEAATTLMKILKNQNKVVLKYFNEIFEGLLNLNVNPDQEVRNVGSSLDEVLKDLVNNNLQTLELINIPDFNIKDLFYKIFEKIRANHPSIKILIVSWITFLNRIPDIKIIDYLPDFLPGLFSMLCDKTKDVNQCSEKCIKHFKKEIEESFDYFFLNSAEVLNKILEILIEQCRSSHDLARLTAFEWLYIFLQKYFALLVKNSDKNSKYQSSYFSKLRSSNVNKNDFLNANGVQKFSLSEKLVNSNTKSPLSSSNLVYVQPEFSFKVTKGAEGEQEPEKKEVTNLKGIPFYLFHNILDVILLNVVSNNELLVSISSECNMCLIEMIDYLPSEVVFNVKQFEEVLKNYFDSQKESTINIILNWISKLFRKYHDEMFLKIEVFIESFTNILSESNEKIFNTVLDILCEISKFKEEYTDLILSKLLEKLCLNKNLLNAKGLVILKKLCLVLPVSRVYLKFSDVLLKIRDYDFISNMLNILDIFLVTYKETEPLRNTLRKYRKLIKSKDSNSESQSTRDFFEKIFTAWSFNPVSTLVLCIISEFFELSYHLILKFGELKMEQEYFIQLSQLVQLIESSLFNNIRVLLLEPVKNIYLIKTLYGILMLLPQGKAYTALSKRMKSIEMLLQIDSDISGNKAEENINEEEIDYFLKIFSNTHMIVKSNV